MPTLDSFLPGRYPAPAASRYQGRWDFRNHYYPVIANLKASGEEFDCARAIDRHPNVRHWVRNLDNELGFWLPTSRGRFFPDFVLELVDGPLGSDRIQGRPLADRPI
jgi:type III restriction enzyme